MARRAWCPRCSANCRPGDRAGEPTPAVTDRRPAQEACPIHLICAPSLKTPSTQRPLRTADPKRQRLSRTDSIAVTNADLGHGARSAPLRQGAPPLADLRQGAPPLAEDFGYFEEVGVEAGAGVEDLDAGEEVVFQPSTMNAWTPSGGVAGMLMRPHASRSPVR